MKLLPFFIQGLNSGSYGFL